MAINSTKNSIEHGHGSWIKQHSVIAVTYGSLRFGDVRSRWTFAWEKKGWNWRRAQRLIKKDRQV